MRRILLWLAGTVVALVLLLGYRTSAFGPSLSSAPVSAVRSGTGSASPAGEAGTPAEAVTGAAVVTRYGNVQVRITIDAGRVTEAVALQAPARNPRDVEANARAVPILNREVLAAQSSGIDMVSGATVTSQAYIESLQSALDQAHL
ncbi:MAG: FMN-binding protein [Dermatophilaceae bacterium]